MDDPNLAGVDGLPRPIKAKITQLINASREAAFAGSQPPEDRQAIREYQDVCRYNLERTIMTLLEKGWKAGFAEAVQAQNKLKTSRETPTQILGSKKED